jgi:PAS domain S-box-containing protein
MARSERKAASDDMQQLRRKAEANLGRVIAKTVPSLAPENVEALVHELRVHQVELQMQCEELRRTQEEVEESRDRYCDLYESAPAAYMTLDRRGTIEQINAAGERLLSAGRTALIGQPFSRYVADEEATTWDTFYREVVRSAGRRSCEVTLTAGQGGAKTVLIDAGVVGINLAEQSLRLIVIDITERKQAEDRLKRQEVELRQQQAELEALNTRLLATEEDVRQSIARDLQKEYSQRIAAIMWQLAAVEQREGLDQRVKYKLQEIKRHLSHLSVDLHHLAHRLHSRFLEHCDLDEAMTEYIDELNTYARPKIVCQFTKVPADCRPAQAVVLFRVLQEALANVAKHADATATTVRLHAVDAELVLEIVDTGKGYDPGHRVSAPAGFGVIIMRERLRTVGGRLAIESTPGNGTTVRASVPLAGTM